MFSQKRKNIYLYPVEKSIKVDAEALLDNNTIVENNVTKIKEVTNPSIEIFKPNPSINNGIGIIVCPGGGYNILAIDLEGYEVGEWLNKLGYTAFVLKYSVPNKRAKALIDLQLSLKIIKEKANDFNIDDTRIGVIGFSAGGSLCARASTSILKNKNLIKPNFTLLIYPAYLDNGENKSLTPELHIDKTTPQMFIFGTADDPHGNSSLVMSEALRKENVPVELHFLLKGGHGYGLRKGNIAAETWPVLAEKWLNKVIK